METIEAHALGQIGGKELDHDLPIETSLGGKKDVTHPPATKLALDGVRIAKSGLKTIVEFRHRRGARDRLSRRRPGRGPACHALREACENGLTRRRRHRRVTCTRPARRTA